MSKQYTIESLCRALRIPQSKIGDGWRIVPAKVGEINGLPTSRGQVVATDGIRCIIIRGGNIDKILIGHLEWFRPDKEEKETRKDDLSFGERMKIARKKKMQIEFVELTD